MADLPPLRKFFVDYYHGLSTGTPSPPIPGLLDDTPPLMQEAEPTTHQKLLPIPSPPMSFSELQSLLTEYQNHIDNNIPLSTVTVPLKSPVRNPITTALPNMTSPEKKGFRLWLSPGGFPVYHATMDWSQCQMATSNRITGNKKTEKMLKALQMMYADESLTKENLFWITEHEEFTILPIVKAFVWVISAWGSGAKHLYEDGGWESWSIEKKEHEVCGAVISGIDKITRGWELEYVRESRKVKALLQKRRDNMAKLLKVYKGPLASKGGLPVQDEALRFWLFDRKDGSSIRANEAAVEEQPVKQESAEEQPVNEETVGGQPVNEETVEEQPVKEKIAGGGVAGSSVGIGGLGIPQHILARIPQDILEIMNRFRAVADLVEQMDRNKATAQQLATPEPERNLQSHDGPSGEAGGESNHKKRKAVNTGNDNRTGAGERAGPEDVSELIGGGGTVVKKIKVEEFE